MRPSGPLSDVLLALGVYAVSAVPFALGVALALTPDTLVHQNQKHLPKQTPPTFLQYSVTLDGAYYRDIADLGYWVYETRQSPIAFFPGHPVAGHLVMRLTGWSPELSLVVVSNLALFAALAFLSAFLRSRYPDQSLGLRATTLALVAFNPAGLYFRTAYSEALFLATVTLFMLSLARRWPIVVVALVAGAATGVRAVGVACTGAVLLHVLLDRERGSLGRRLLECAALAPVACWGLLAFMAYQYIQFDNPLAFAEAQKHWGHPVPPLGDISAPWVRLAIAEPIWGAYVPSSPRFWTFIDHHGIPGLGQGFWNPIAVVLSLAAVALGWWRGWLTRTEAVLGLALVLIPYVTRGHAMSMACQARFVSVAAPAFVVFGRVLNRCPPAVSCAVIAVMASLLTVWSAMFGAWWPLF
jgi:hypothetical protein